MKQKKELHLVCPSCQYGGMCVRSKYGCPDEKTGDPRIDHLARRAFLKLKPAAEYKSRVIVYSTTTSM